MLPESGRNRNRAGLSHRYDNANRAGRRHPLTSIGALLVGLSQVYWLLWIVIPDIRGGEPARPKPWEGAEGLKWTVPSPAPHHTFAHPPMVK